MPITAPKYRVSYHIPRSDRRIVGEMVLPAGDALEAVLITRDYLGIIGAVMDSVNSIQEWEPTEEE